MGNGGGIEGGKGRIESQYNYEGPSVEGPGKPLTEKPAEGKGPIFGDQLVRSTNPAIPPKTPNIDAPELPIPSLRAVGKAEVKREIGKQAALKGAAGGGSGILANSWMANPSWMVAFMNKSMDLVDLFSRSRYAESQRKQETELNIARLGIEGANIEKDSKMAQSAKEKLTGVGHIMGAVSAGIQLASMPGSRGKARAEAEKSEAGKLRKTEKEKLEKMEIDKGFRATDGTPTGKKLTAKNQDVAAQRKKVEKLDKEVRHEIDLNMQRQTTMIDNHKRMIDGATNGVIEIQKSLITEHEADLAKKKGLNDVVQQTLTKANDGTNKSKDDDLATVNKMHDQMRQTSEHNQRTFQLKG